MKTTSAFCIPLAIAFSLSHTSLTSHMSHTATAQPYGPPDRGEPGDLMIQQYLDRQTEKIHGTFMKNVTSAEDWQHRRAEYEKQYYYMLGLWPVPERTPLRATITGTYAGDGFVVEKLHYQSRPRLYVTANLYRPSKVDAGERLPAVLYVCGHSGRGRNGNKTAFQSHGIWFARHGYVCLVVDTLQLGEIAAIHHGTYREDRWWWYSRGYTPAGVECWNGVRGIDYLVSRPDVDPERIAVTGISGGGAATFWIAAADPRVKVAVPVSGMADLPSYVSNRVINGHCDCMFLYNTYQWPWTQIAAMVAPRPMLFVNSDADPIFPMDANERVINGLERLYSLFGAGDQVDSFVSIGGHDYRQDIRQAAFRFINLHLKNDPRRVTDSEVDLVVDENRDARHPIPPEQLRAFPTDADIPQDELNTTIDQHFVPLAEVALPGPGQFAAWKQALAGELREVSFGVFPERIEPAKQVHHIDDRGVAELETEPGIRVQLQRIGARKSKPARVLVLVDASVAGDPQPRWVAQTTQENDLVYQLQTRGRGASRWTQKNPPNYVARCHVLVGRTVDTGRVWDVVAVARYVRSQLQEPVDVYVVGEQAASVICAYAALWEEDIAGVIIHNPPRSHMESGAPPILNVLRVCDVPHVLGMLAPRPITLYDSRQAWDDVRKVYKAAGAEEKFSFHTE